MTDIARLSFGEADLRGALVLSDDGTVRIEPSAELRDALAAREETALALADRWGARLGLGLVALGLAAVAGGWAAGRIYGKYAGRLLWRRPVHEVSIAQDAAGTLRVTLGKTSWVAGPCAASEAEQFQKHLEEIKGDA